MYRILAILVVASLLVLTSFGGYEKSFDNDTGQYVASDLIDSPLIDGQIASGFVPTFNMNIDSDVPHDTASN